MILASAISNWKHGSPHWEQTAPGICMGNFTQCGSGTLRGAPSGAEDTGDTHHGRQVVQAWTLPLTAQATLSKSGSLSGPPYARLLREG